MKEAYDGARWKCVPILLLYIYLHSTAARIQSITIASRQLLRLLSLTTVSCWEGFRTLRYNVLDAFKLISPGCKNFVSLYYGKICKLKTYNISRSENYVCRFLKLLPRDIFSVYVIISVPLFRLYIFESFLWFKHKQKKRKYKTYNTRFACLLFRCKNIANVKSLALQWKLHMGI